MSVVIVVAVIVFGIAALNAAVRYAAAVYSAELSQRILTSLRGEVYDKLQRLSFHFFDANESSSLINRAAGDVNGVRAFVDGVIIRVLTVTLTLAVYLVYMLNVHVGLTLACLATSPFLWVGAIVFSRVVQPAYRQSSELVDQAVTTLVENVQGAQVVKGFGREQDEIARFRSANRRIREQREGIFWRVSTFQPTMGGLTQVNMVVLLIYGGSLVIRGQIPLGAGLFVMANLLHEFANQVGNIINIANTIQASLIAAQRVFEVLDAPVQITSPPNAERLPRSRGEVSFQHVYFEYKPGQPVLRDIHFEVRPGECLGICGETGSGKSTLLSLIARFYDTTSGAVRVDNINVRQLELDDLRRKIGIVFQESFLFSNTVAANIAFGHPEATTEQIERAARVAAAHEFIVSMPDAYEAVVGEHGNNLSGGQRQRLAIARALLLDPPILILDDAMAAIDPETEHEIQAAIENAMRGRTTFLVANRISALRRADRIVVLHQGRVVQIGTHDELIRQPGSYRILAELQFA
jgi:ABC-type multidrug transport system fused ATPase/permease subunit